MKDILKKIYRRITPWNDIDKKIYNAYLKMHRNYDAGRKTISKYYCYLIGKKYHCIISPGATIKNGLSLPHPNGVVIGGGSVIEKNVVIYQQVTIGQNHGKYPHIGKDVIIYAGAKILGEVYIGDNSIIGANAVVISDVPKNTIWGGIPAKELKKRDKEEVYN